MREEVTAAARREFSREGLASHPTVAALRRLFRAVGCDPTRYRPSSEALLRRVLKGAALPAIDAMVDLNNCLSLRLAVPCCVMDAHRIAAPFRFRAGAAGDQYESLKGLFDLENKPVLFDAEGPCDAPITGSERVKIRPSTQRAWLVAYLPEEIVEVDDVEQTLDRLLRQYGAARISGGL